jgi:hypothetical protein
MEIGAILTSDGVNNGQIKCESGEVAVVSNTGALECKPYATEALTDWSETTETIITDSLGVNVKSATTLTDQLKWRRVGTDIEVEASYYHQAVAGSSGTGTYRWKLPNNLQIDMSKVVAGAGNSVATYGRCKGDVGGSSLEEFIATPNVDGISLTSRPVSNFVVGSGTSYAFNNTFIGISCFFKVPVVGWTSNNSVSSFECDNFSCINSFSARILATEAVLSENVDWINGDCSFSVDTTTCNFKTGLFTVAPACTITTRNDNTPNNNAFIRSLTSSAISFTSYYNGGINGSLAHSIICERQGSDYNQASNKFFPVVDQEARLARVTAPDFTGTALTKMAITSTKDNYSIVNNSLNRYEIDKSGEYELCAGGFASFGASNWVGVSYAVNGGSTVSIGSIAPTSSSGIYLVPCRKVDLVAGDYVELWFSSGSTSAFVDINSTIELIREDKTAYIGNVDPLDLSRYSDSNTSDTVTGGYTNASGQYRILVNGKKVTVTFSMNAGNSGGSPANIITLGSIIPAAYRPAHQITGGGFVIDTSADTMGFPYINADGTINCTIRDFTGGGFTATGIVWGVNTGCNSSITYIID